MKVAVTGGGGYIGGTLMRRSGVWILNRCGPADA